jgi:hypothetical protein
VQAQKIAMPEDFDEWCKPNEVNMSIPDSLEVSSQGPHSSQSDSSLNEMEQDFVDV